LFLLYFHSQLCSLILCVSLPSYFFLALVETTTGAGAMGKDRTTTIATDR
jgi:hypothetical protein